MDDVNTAGNELEGHVEAQVRAEHAQFFIVCYMIVSLQHTFWV